MIEYSPHLSLPLPPPPLFSQYKEISILQIVMYKIMNRAILNEVEYTLWPVGDLVINLNPWLYCKSVNAQVV